MKCINWSVFINLYLLFIKLLNSLETLEGHSPNKCYDISGITNNNDLFISVGNNSEIKVW